MEIAAKVVLYTAATIIEKVGRGGRRMASKQELAEYVGAVASELSRMCCTQRLDVLAHLLQMVTLEATEVTTRQKANQKSGK
jgi:hypothetical protein